MRSSFPARSSKARATAVMASTPPRRSYRESSTVPTSCALVTNGATVFPASHILKPFNRRQVNLYLPLTDRAGRLGGAWGTGAADGPSRLRPTTSARRKYAADASPDNPWDCRCHVRHKPVGSERGVAPRPGDCIPQPDHPARPRHSQLIFWLLCGGDRDAHLCPAAAAVPVHPGVGEAVHKAAVCERAGLLGGPAVAGQAGSAW